MKGPGIERLHEALTMPLSEEDRMLAYFGELDNETEDRQRQTSAADESHAGGQQQK